MTDCLSVRRSPRLLREEASPFPKQRAQVDDLWLQVFEEFLEVNGNERLRHAKPEPMSEKRGHLLQCMAATVLGVLPGLAKLMIQTRGWRSPRGMVAHLRAVTLQPTVQHSMDGFAATILDYFIFPFMLHHPRPALSVEATPITTKTLTLLMRWQKARNL
jgi:hypothetical protein